MDYTRRLDRPVDRSAGAAVQDRTGRAVWQQRCRHLTGCLQAAKTADDESEAADIRRRPAMMPFALDYPLQFALVIGSILDIAAALPDRHWSIGGRSLCGGAQGRKSAIVSRPH
jgi:hypothetical protein